MKIVLTRNMCSQTCTPGTLTYTDANGIDREFSTLELPWNDNKPGCSCIPPGIYRCERTWSKKFGETFVVCEVPDRAGILFHQGNFTSSTRGCILVGKDVKPYGQSFMVTDSKNAMRQFLDSLKGVTQFTLEIR